MAILRHGTPSNSAKNAHDIRERSSTPRLRLAANPSAFTMFVERKTFPPDGVYTTCIL